MIRSRPRRQGSRVVAPDYWRKRTWRQDLVHADESSTNSRQCGVMLENFSKLAPLCVSGSSKALKSILGELFPENPSWYGGGELGCECVAAYAEAQPSPRR